MQSVAHGQVKLCFFWCRDGVVALVLWCFFDHRGRKALEKQLELTRFAKYWNMRGLGRLHIHMHLSCCKPVHHDLPNIETRGTDWMCEHTEACLLLQACPPRFAKYWNKGDWLACTYVQQKSAKNRQNPHHSLEPNWIQMTREGYGWLLHSCCNDRYPLNVRIHHDSFSTLVLQWSPLAWQIHLRSSVSPRFTHARWLSYIIKKRFTKGNVRELDIDRESCRSLNMKWFCKKYFQKMHGRSVNTFISTTIPPKFLKISSLNPPYSCW